MHVFGPVPSRRFGRSLGINNIPPKTCTYSCIYCQRGRTTRMPLERAPFYSPETLIGEARAAIAEMGCQGETIDYLTFVPDGEPTLDANLGKAITLAGKTGHKVAVITNGSLLWDPSVRDDLSAADAVSVKATRGERLGPEGRGEAVTVHAVAMIFNSEPGTSA